MPRRRQSRSKQATRLARLRTKRGMSQMELAKATGISIATLRRLERGRMANPPLRYLSNCAIVLDVELEELIEDSWRSGCPWRERSRHETHSRFGSPIDTRASGGSDSASGRRGCAGHFRWLTSGERTLAQASATTPEHVDSSFATLIRPRSVLR